MVGYKNEKYMDFGKFSAKVDDAANFIPARITGILILYMEKNIVTSHHHPHRYPNAL